MFNVSDKSQIVCLVLLIRFFCGWQSKQIANHTQKKTLQKKKHTMETRKRKKQQIDQPSQALEKKQKTHDEMVQQFLQNDTARGIENELSIYHIQKKVKKKAKSVLNKRYAESMNFLFQNQPPRDFTPMILEKYIATLIVEFCAFQSEEAKNAFSYLDQCATESIRKYQLEKKMPITIELVLAALMNAVASSSLEEACLLNEIFMFRPLMSLLKVNPKDVAKIQVTLANEYPCSLKS